MARSRGGCGTCKKRHRKCDETRPSCRQCQASGLECSGYQKVLSWDVGVASRGRLRGAVLPVQIQSRTTGAVSKPKSGTRPPRTPEPSRTPVRRHLATALDPPDELDEPIRQPPGMLDDASPRDLEHTSSWASFLPNTQSSLVKDASTSATGAGYVSPSSEPNDAGHDDESRHLLNEFTKTTVYLLYSTSTRDTLRTHLYNLAQQSEPLYNVLIAIHLYTSNPENPPPQFEEYYDRSLRMFRDQLARYDGTLNEGLMSAGIFICTLNLFQANPWSAHLKHMLQVYGFDASGGQLGRFADMKLRFPVEVMAVMDLPTFVRGRQTTTLGIWTRFRGAQQALHGRKESGVELVSGIPRSLLDIFATIEDESAEAAFLSWPGEVGEVPQCHLWEAYRLAGVLVGRRLRRKQHDETHSGSGSPTAETLLARLVAALDALCDTRLRPEYSHLLALNATLYPCTAARQEIATLRGRPGWVDQLRRILRLCEPYGKTANAKTVDKMLNEALEGGDDDFDIDEVAKKRGVEISLL